MRFAAVERLPVCMLVVIAGFELSNCLEWFPTRGEDLVDHRLDTPTVEVFVQLGQLWWVVNADVRMNEQISEGIVPTTLDIRAICVDGTAGFDVKLTFILFHFTSLNTPSLLCSARHKRRPLVHFNNSHSTTLSW